MNDREPQSSRFDIVELPVDATATWRQQVPRRIEEPNPLGPNDPGPGDAELEWVLGLQRGHRLAAVVWLRRCTDGGWARLGVASASVATCDEAELIRLLNAAVRRVVAGGAEQVVVHLPVARLATLHLLEGVGFQTRSVLVFGGIAEAELDLRPAWPGRDETTAMRAIGEQAR